MPGVTCYGVRSACDDCIVEVRQIGCEKADNFRGDACEFVAVGVS